MTDFLKRAMELFPEMQKMRRHIHQHPELSFKEFETSAFIQKRLTELQIPFKVVATTGVVAHIGSGNNCVALRADIDALPIHEETGLPFASTNDGVMHACGHDTHTTMLLGAAQMLKEHEAVLKGTVKLLFQPGEEKTPGGATMMISEGALESPTPSMIFGQHVNPDAPLGEISFVDGPMLAAADELYWTINGSGAHAAQPHLGKDPIFTATGLVQHLQSLIVRNRNPFHAGVMTVTSIAGGHATNIIPEQVTMKGTLRAFDQEWRESAWDWLTDQTEKYCRLHGCTGALEISKGYPPVVNTTSAVELATSVARDTFGTGRVSNFEPKMWAEDFAYYSQMMPACFWMLGVRPSDLTSMPGLHHPKFSPDEQAMITGAALLSNVAVRALEQGNGNV